MRLQKVNRIANFSVWIILSLISIIGCTREKDRLDAEVRRLCAQDGGVKVYETVELPPDEFDRYVDKYGDFRLPSITIAKADDEYVYEDRTQFLREGNPSLRRYHMVIVRRLDNKILGESVVYSRVGGDIPGPWHESVFRCPVLGEAGLRELQLAIFSRENK